jgi:8-oxo-dGTP pyrophosphatase MutT (NUDIX family)
MSNDLKFKIENTIINIRVGVILRYNDKIIVEVSKVGRNSIVPGGRIKAGESSNQAAIREIKEETGLTLNINNIISHATLENFFTYDGENVHEIYFLKGYELTKTEVDAILNLRDNLDNETTYFVLAEKSEFEKLNLLPLELYNFV